MLRTSLRVAALVALSLIIVIPDAIARGGRGGGFSGGARGFSGGHGFSGARSFSAGRSFSAPRSYAVSRSYSAPRSYAASRSYARSYAVARSSPARSYAAPRQIASRHVAMPRQVAARSNPVARHIAQPNAGLPRVAAPHAVARAHANAAAGIPGRSFAAVPRNAIDGRGRAGFHLAGAASRPLGGHALHNKFVAGRFGAAGIHGTRFAHAGTFKGHFPHRVWHRHRFARWVVIGWAGPLFWPYAYDDFVGYTFYPYAYDTFWPYAYDDVYDGIFGRYAYGRAPVRVVEPAPDGTVAAPAPAVAAPVRAPVDVCRADTAANLTDWPIDQIALAVEPTDAQRAALEGLRAATAQALDVLKSACPTDLPSTPTGRIAAMQKRIDVMLLAVRTVRPAMDAFYRTLSDEQKARFSAIGPEEAAQSNERDLSQACNARAAGIASLPIDRIEQAVRPNEVQRAALRDLRDAMSASVALLTSECPTDRALTPVGRIEAMEQRLGAMSRAVQTLRPALDRFYGTLSDEQKERFNRLAPAQS